MSGKKIEIWRCPFCGEEADVFQAGNKGWVIGCDGKMDALCPGYIWKYAPIYYTREQAIKFWNERTVTVDGFRPAGYIKPVVQEKRKVLDDETDDGPEYSIDNFYLCPDCRHVISRNYPRTSAKFCENCGLELEWRTAGGGE